MKLPDGVLETDMAEFLDAYPEEAQALAIATAGMPPQEALRQIAKAMIAQAPPQRPRGREGSQPCPGCGRPISANKPRCLQCKGKEDADAH